MKIRRCNINDVEIVDKILKHSDVFNFITDDFSLPIDEFTGAPLLENDAVYVLIDDGESFCSIFIPQNGILYSGHQNVLPEIRGKKAVEIGKMMCQWMFNNTNCEKIIGYVPETNKPAKMFAFMMGFKFEHRLTGAMRKDGRNIALDIVTKEE